jgi:signal transduction histidine kinase
MLEELKVVSQEKMELSSREKAAQEASRLKSEFLANMSHEIRTPLNGILGMAQLLMSTNLSDEQFENTKIIKDSGESLLGMINNILDFSKIEAGRMEIEKSDFDLADVIEKVERVMSYFAKSKNIEFRVVHPDKNLFIYHSDTIRIQQILFNFCHNALKFTEKGFVRVFVEILPQAGNSDLCRFHVQDTGIGIDESQIENIFNPFTQADTTTTRRYGGTGLGLSISKRLSEQLGGSIEVKSEINKGSEFIFNVNLERATVKLNNKISKAIIKNESKELFQNNRVLIAEDNTINQKLITRVVSNLGLSYDVVENGKQVLKSILTNQYSLILMDCHMPEMDGFTTSSVIRTHKDKPKLLTTRVMSF